MAAVQLDSGLLIGFLFLATCLVVAVRSYLRSGGADGGRGGAAITSPPALPVIGNLHQLGRGRHHRALRELARRHGPLFQLRLGSVRALVVSSASMAEAVLRHQDHVFCGRPQQHTARGTLYGCRDVAFSPYGERWRRLRRVAVVHLLSARRVDSFRALREEEVASFVNRIRAASGGGGGVVNLTELIVGLTHAVVSRAAFGKKLGGVEPAKVRETVGELADLLGTIAVSDMFPRLRWVDWATGLDARTKRTAAKLDEVLEMVLRDHEPSRGDDDDDDGDGEARDLMDDLLSMANGGDDHGYKLDRIDVKGLLILVRHVRGRHGHSLQVDRMNNGRAHQEPSRNGESASRGETCRSSCTRRRRRRRRRRHRQGGAGEQLGKMTLLRAAMKEAMRLHPPLPLLIPREAIQDTVLHGHRVAAGTRVMINAWAIGRDEAAWEDAGEFRPGRFADGGDNAGVEYYGGGGDFRFMPFGAGRRGCPGMAFATRLAELVVANMACWFEWELPDGQDVQSFEPSRSSSREVCRLGSSSGKIGNHVYVVQTTRM
uniref:Cytochrome P450 n=2 Tax=Oryza sativa subsp. japonica TaxID=39947 RepID=Q5Z9V4_ORYSJ|nr:cytochrome P450 71A1 [Oryza sativa Japonica Group]BAD53519.1 putative cytochrome P450 [Oryza sativa Japonica Group]